MRGGLGSWFGGLVWGELVWVGGGVVVWALGWFGGWLGGWLGVGGFGGCQQKDLFLHLMLEAFAETLCAYWSIMVT